MRSYRVPVFVMLCLLTVNLSVIQAQQPRPINRPPRTLSLDDEAKQEAEKYWYRILAHCGDSYLTKEFLGWSGPGSMPPSYRGYTVYEFKGILIETKGQRVEQSPLSAADVLNGVKRETNGPIWNGNSYLQYNVARMGTHSDGDLPGKLSWSPWEDGRAGTIWYRLQRGVKVDKTAGRWSFSDSYYSNMPKFRVPVKCDLSDIDSAGVPNQTQPETRPDPTRPTPQELEQFQDVDLSFVRHDHNLNYGKGFKANAHCSGSMRLSGNGLTYKAADSGDGKPHTFVFTCEDMRRFNFSVEKILGNETGPDDLLIAVINGKTEKFKTGGSGFNDLEVGIERLCRNKEVDRTLNADFSKSPG